MTIYSLARYEPLTRDLLRHAGQSIRLAGAQTLVATDNSLQGLAVDGSEQEVLLKRVLRRRN